MFTLCPMPGAVAFAIVLSRLTVGAAVPRGLRFLESSPEQPFLSTLRNQSMSHLQRNKAKYVNKDITPARQQRAQASGSQDESV